MSLRRNPLIDCLGPPPHHHPVSCQLSLVLTLFFVLIKDRSDFRVNIRVLEKQSPVSSGVSRPVASFRSAECACACACPCVSEDLLKISAPAPDPGHSWSQLLLMTAGAAAPPAGRGGELHQHSGSIQV